MKGLSKEKRKLVERLRSPRFRPREGLFLVEGARGVAEVLAGRLPLEIRFALVSPRLEEIQGGVTLREKVAEGGFPVLEVEDTEMREISETEAPQGVLLVVEEPQDPWGPLYADGAPRLLVLDGVQDPGNVGTLLRGARAFGATGVLALDGTADPWNSKAVRAAAGAFAHLPVVRTPWPEANEWLRARAVPLLAADAQGEDVRAYASGPSWALAVGNEGAGTRAEILESAQGVVAVPMAPGVDSLNAGVAGSVLLYALSLGQNENEGGEA
jgi:TrmH family RNA methyltransferase